MIVLVGIGGGLAGAIGLSVLTALLSAILEPETFGVGQFAVGFAYSVPAGVVLGSATTLAVRQSRRRHRLSAGWIAALGGAAAVAFATAVAWGSANSQDGGFAGFVRELVSLWIGPSWLAGAALMIWGAYRLTKSVRERTAVG